MKLANGIRAKGPEVLCVKLTKNYTRHARAKFVSTSRKDCRSKRNCCGGRRSTRTYQEINATCIDLVAPSRATPTATTATACDDCGQAKVSALICAFAV